MKLPRRENPQKYTPRRIYTRLVGVALFIGACILLTPLSENWYVCAFIPLSWFGYVGIVLSLSIMAFPDWWETHES